ncbi:hypothetical protein P691DRAFT_327320 [Macrolepiota fuliginosa MF-IS2]|uniref:Uncharacterized protein n=1 Tax=Macrolepiota fuliginosa MF-IS2 TaxID=1400762 RepID=A0A9P5XIV4_9AGAR|nr:hypothetical protein P691DRAFT_327320 [Macrolepiota fuliginosa MF-IS2]
MASLRVITFGSIPVDAFYIQGSRRTLVSTDFLSHLSGLPPFSFINLNVTSVLASGAFTCNVTARVVHSLDADLVLGDDWFAACRHYIPGYSIALSDGSLLHVPIPVPEPEPAVNPSLYATSPAPPQPTLSDPCPTSPRLSLISSPMQNDKDTSQMDFTVERFGGPGARRPEETYPDQ